MCQGGAVLGCKMKPYCSQAQKIMDVLVCGAPPSGPIGALAESTQTGTRVGFSLLLEME